MRRLPFTLLALLMLTGVLGAQPAAAAPDPPWRLTIGASAAAAAAPIYTGTSAIALNSPNFWFTYYGVDCWRDGAQKSVYNKTGGVLYRAIITVEWCEANGRITNQTKMTCDTSAWFPYYKDQNCTHGVGISGQATQSGWADFGIGIGVPGTVFKQSLDIDVNIILTASPKWSGGWKFQYLGW